MKRGEIWLIDLGLAAKVTAEHSSASPRLRGEA
jgi:hypothetical protein